jgi:alkylation response protein AidB-like acyl-CoA dehydrogenase
MNFDLTEEQSLLKGSLEKFVADRCALDQRKRYLAEPDGYSAENWRLLAELGVLALNLPEDYGGLGLGAVESMLAMDQLGRGLVVEPFVSTIVLGARFLTHAGSDAQKADWLPRVAAGEAKLALAQAEAQGRYSLTHVATSATPAPGGYLLNGQKIAALHAQSADALVVVARSSGPVRSSDGVSLFLVPGDAPGLSRVDYRLADGQAASDVTLRNVHVTADALIGPLGEGFGALETVVGEALLALSAEAVGAMSAVFDATLDYVKTRKQFGQPIGAFQAIQHRMADCYMAVEQARSLVLKGFLHRYPSRSAWLAGVTGIKAFVSEAGLKVSQEAIQFHGGMGVTDELIVSHYHKRLLVIAALFGDVATTYARYGALAKAG